MSEFQNIIPIDKPNYSKFDLSCDHKLSLKLGELVPVHLQECLPGDFFRMSSEAMMRMMPMVTPIMHKLDVTFHHFFCPTRILWDNFEDFMTGGEDGTIEPAFPYINRDDISWTVQPSTLADYLGLPVDQNMQHAGPISAVPFGVYHRIWWEYYRDQNLQDSDAGYSKIDLVDGLQGGTQAVQLLEMRRRAWQHDYFTSCLPFPQKGAPVELPLEFTNFPVVYTDENQQGQIIKEFGGGWVTTSGSVDAASGPSVNGNMSVNAQSVYMDPNGTLEVDAEQITTITTINDLRNATALQRWLEKNARGGSRYTEVLLNHFNVKSQDHRLQRPEYLGGSKSTMSISEVLQTSESSTTPQGTLAGHGISINGGQDFSYSVKEHGYIMTILSVTPKTSYYQGIPKHFSKNDKYEFYWPDFAKLGEEPVKMKELYYDGTATVDDNNADFGYLPRYSDYRYNSSRISGQMATTLNKWHMARDVSGIAALNEDFIVCDPTNRIFAVTDPTTDKIVAHIYHKIEASRPLPKYGVPSSL